MGRKNSQHSQTSGIQSEEEELTIEQQIENRIKQLPTLKEKVQAIALNHHIIEKRRIDKELGVEITKMEIEFRKRYAPLLNEINNIVAGTHTYSDSDFENTDILNEEESKLKHNYYKNEEFSEYWFKALISSDVIGEQIRQIDEPLFKHLIRVDAIKEADNNLKINFTFSENEWFTNTILTKEFELEGDEIKRSFGGDINWKEGKNITVKIVKKKGKKGKKTTQKQVQSFFNFFKEIDLTEDEPEDKVEEQENAEDEQQQQVSKLERQYEIANEFYENIVPKSLEYFLGVVGAGDFGDYEGLDAIGEQQEEEEEPETKAPKKKSKSSKRKGSAASSGKEQ